MRSIRAHGIAVAVAGLAMLGCGEASSGSSGAGAAGTGGDASGGSGATGGGGGAEAIEELAKKVNPGGLAVEGETLYFTTNDPSLSVRSMPKSGGEHVEVITTDGAGLVGPPVLVGDEIVFASRQTADGALWVGPLVGGAATAIATATGSQSLVVASDGTNAYWWVDGVYSVPIDGSGTGSLVAAECDEPFILDGTTFFCVNDADEIVSVESGSSSVTVIATGTLERVALAVDADNVYWLQSHTSQPLTTTSQLFRAPRSGGPATELWSDSGSDFAPVPGASLVLDGGHLYFSAGPLIRYSLSNGEAVVLTPHGYVFPPLALDATHVYFTQQYTPDIYTPLYWRIARVPR